MPRVPRGALPAAFALLLLDFAALATQPPAPMPAAAVAPVVASSTTTTSTTSSTTSTTAVAPRTTAAPPVRPVPTTAAPRSGASTATTGSPRTQTSAKVACGWDWDATRIDDGSSNEVTMTLTAASRPNASVTITAQPGGPTTPAMSHTTSTDGAGQALATFSLSQDKRDWTITISASFTAGGTCPPETFTLSY